MLQSQIEYVCIMQVLHQGSQVSACAIVKGTQRNLFVVPTSDTFEDEDLKSLQQEIDADPSLKGQLMKRLHVSFTITEWLWTFTHSKSSSFYSVSCSDQVA